MQFFKTTDGLDLAYLDEGEGPAVLCLAGLTRDHHDFDEMAAFLLNVRLIRLDARGRGMSAHDPDFLNYNPMVEARDALELLDHLGVPKAAIIGSSRGGILAMVIAATAKNRLSGVLLNDVGPIIGDDELRNIVSRLGVNPPFESYEDARLKFPPTMAGFHNVSQARWNVEIRRLWIEGPNGLTLRYDPKLRDAIQVAMAQPSADLWPLFEALSDLPLALLRGKNSTLLSPETANEMQRRRPDMLFANVRDRAHIPFLDEPESVETINKFIKAVV